MTDNEPLSNIETASIFEVFQALSERTDDLREAVRRIASPPEGLRASRVFRAGDVARLLGVSERWLRNFAVENRDVLRIQEDGFGRLYTPGDIHRIRNLGRLGPLRPAGTKACVVAVMNFKGGSGKSSTSVALAQSMAARGYRVLFIDMDPQGSASACFDYMHDGRLVSVGELGLDYEDTMGVLLEPAGAPEEVVATRTLSTIARKTHWETIDVIPACPALLLCDFYGQANQSPRSEASHSGLPGWAVRFRQLMSTITDYDVVVVDTPPAVNRSIFGVATGADILVAPVRCAQFDIDALNAWIDVQNIWFSKIKARWYDQLKHIQLRFVLNDRSSQSGSEGKIERVVRSFYGQAVAAETIPHLEALKRGGGSAPSVFDEQPKQPHSLGTAASKARSALNDAFDEIRDLIARGWTTSGTEEEIPA